MWTYLPLLAQETSLRSSRDQATQVTWQSFFVFVFVCDSDGEDDDREDIQMVFISVTQATFFCAFIQFPYLSNLLNWRTVSTIIQIRPKLNWFFIQSRDYAILASNRIQNCNNLLVMHKGGGWVGGCLGGQNPRNFIIIPTVAIVAIVHRPFTIFGHATSSTLKGRVIMRYLKKVMVRILSFLLSQLNYSQRIILCTNKHTLQLGASFDSSVFWGPILSF